MNHVKLFEPITINGLEIKNRIVMPAMALAYTYDFSFNEKLADFYRARATGGVGLMTIGPLAIGSDTAAPFMPGLFTDEHGASIRALLDELHRTTDVKAATQLMHMGRNSVNLSGAPPMAPSAIPGKMNPTVPREMTLEDIEAVKTQFAVAAKRAMAAGFDFIEIIACTGYLISQFLSPLSNQRSDAYGGSFEKRIRFGLEVIDKVRQAVGPDFPLGIRIAGNDFMPGGNTNIESARFAAEAEKHGIDAINVTGGWHETNIPQLTTIVPPGAFLYLARGIRNSVNIPVFASNRLGDPDVAERALRSGACDMVCWGRPLLADPELPRKIREGRMDEITYCVACNQGCFDAVTSGTPVHCVVNPRLGREGEVQVEKSPVPKKLLVAGGGPAGLEFALTAAQRGHDVTLCEKADYLGGQVNQAKASPGKAELGRIISSLENRARHNGVKIRLNASVSKDVVEKEKPDVLVVATGAKPIKINVPGVDNPHVLNAWDVLTEKSFVSGRNIVIIGGSATGCETAHFLSELGTVDAETFKFLSYHSAEDLEYLGALLFQSPFHITVVDMMPRMAANVGRTSRWALMKSLKLMDVMLKPGTTLVEITDEVVIVDGPEGRESIPADAVILAIGAAPVNDLAGQFKNEDIEVMVIGDAVQPRKITDAIREGFELALKV
jgi:2,4-dienoyl-CoA reductase (NADPH2)